MTTGLPVKVEHEPCNCHPETCNCNGAYVVYVGKTPIGRYGKWQAPQIAEIIKQSEKSYDQS